MRPRDPRHRCTLGQRRFDDPLLLVDCAVLPLGFGPRRALDWDEFCDLRGSVHLRSQWTRSVCVHFKRMTSNYTPVQTVAAVRLHPLPRLTGRMWRRENRLHLPFFGRTNGASLCHHLLNDISYPARSCPDASGLPGCGEKSASTRGPHLQNRTAAKNNASTRSGRYVTSTNAQVTRSNANARLTSNTSSFFDMSFLPAAARMDCAILRRAGTGFRVVAPTRLLSQIAISLLTGS